MNQLKIFNKQTGFRESKKSGNRISQECSSPGIHSYFTFIKNKNTKI